MSSNLNVHSIHDMDDVIINNAPNVQNVQINQSINFINSNTQNVHSTDLNHVPDYSDDSSDISDMDHTSTIDIDIDQKQVNDMDNTLFNRKNGILLCFWNIDGVSNNIETHLNYVIHSKKVDYFALQECYKCYNVKNENFSFFQKYFTSYIMEANGFGKVVSLVRNGVQHRNVVVSFKPNNEIDKLVKNLDKNALDYNDKRKHLQMKKLYQITTEFYSNSPNDPDRLVINYYRPQHGTDKTDKLSGSQAELAVKYLELLTNKKQFRKHKIIFGGDGNVHHSLWMNDKIKNRYSNAVKQGKIFAEWIDKNDWQILSNGDTTRIENNSRTSPDLIIGSTNIDTDKLDFWIEDFGRRKWASDHLTMFLFIRDENVMESADLEYVIRNGDKLNWNDYNAELETSLKNWYSEYGTKMSNLLQDYLKVKPEARGRIDKNALINNAQINSKECILGINNLLTNVIVGSAKNAFGMRVKRTVDNMPWMTKEIKESYDNYASYLKKFQSFSKRKRKKMKRILNDLKEKKDEFASVGKIKWIQNEIRKCNENGNNSWNEMKNIIKYDSKTNKSIPTWVDDSGNYIAKSSQEKCDVWMDYKHRFDERKSDIIESNAEYENILDTYKKNRWKNITNKKLKDELFILNNIISKKDIKRAIMSFRANAAVFDDGCSHKYLQNGIDLLLEPIYIIYNIMFILEIRSPLLNESFVTLLPKGSKPKQTHTNWRPITISSNLGKPLDKIMAYRFLGYGIRLKLIQTRHFGFIKGLGCFDAVAYLLHIIYKNRNEGNETHLVLLDYHAAFDTVEHDGCLNMMEFEFKVIGNALGYLKAAFNCRWSKMKINGYYSDWKKDIIGLGQGWPPSAILFIFVSIELDVVNTLNLGIIMIGYADDTSVASTGEFVGAELETKMNYAIDLINYISMKKQLIMHQLKQKYIVISDNNTAEIGNELHRQLYLKLQMNGESIDRVYTYVKYLGLSIDTRLLWDYHINNLHRNAKHCAIKIYNRYKYAPEMLAKWLPQIYNAFVVSKIINYIEFWNTAKACLLNKIRTIYNNIISHCNGAERSHPLNHQFMQIGLPDFDDLMTYKKSVGFSRIIRSPETNILCKIIKQYFWKKWQYERANDEISALDNMNNEYIEYNDLIVNNNLTIFNIQPKEIEIENYLPNNPEICDDWEKKESMNDEYLIKNSKKKEKYHPFDAMFQCARSIGNSDYLVMKGIEFEIIPKRISFHETILDCPINLIYHEFDNIGEDIGFTMDWLDSIIEKYEIDTNLLQLIMPDGSEKCRFGGSGFFSCNYKFYSCKLSLDEMRELKYDMKSKSPMNGYADYCYGSRSVGIRCSIEFTRENVEILL